jgi:hypothetical protein
MNKYIPVVLLMMSAPAWGQSFYKCPSSTPGAPPMIQQMPCSPIGGQTIKVNPIKKGDGSIEESIERMKGMSSNINKEWNEQKEKDEKENHRLEALAVESDKAKATVEAARITAAAIRSLRW